MKNKTIAIDSGIILDSNRVKQQWLLINLGLKLDLWQVNKTECEPLIGSETYERMRQEVFSREGILSHPVMDGVKEFFYRFRENEFYMLTVKTPKFIPYIISWLHQNIKSFSIIPKVFTAYDTTKARICEQEGIDIIIDDDIRHLREIPDSVKRIFLKLQQPNKNLEGITQFGSWNEVAEYLDQPK